MKVPIHAPGNTTRNPQPTMNRLDGHRFPKSLFSGNPYL
jgi:hypothetical protein